MDPVFRSLTEIEAHIREKLTVTTIAESIHISKYHYQRLFREAVVVSVMRYVSLRRMALTVAELTETDASILEIALRKPYCSTTFMKGSSGRSHVTLGTDFANSLISGYSSPVSTKTAGIFGKARLARSNATVESLPADQETATLPSQCRYHSMIFACATWIFRSSGHACIVLKSCMV